jgi:chromosome segregation ATPase
MEHREQLEERDGIIATMSKDMRVKNDVIDSLSAKLEASKTASSEIADLKAQLDAKEKEKADFAAKVKRDIALMQSGFDKAKANAKAESKAECDAEVALVKSECDAKVALTIAECNAKVSSIKEECNAKDKKIKKLEQTLESDIVKLRSQNYDIKILKKEVADLQASSATTRERFSDALMAMSSTTNDKTSLHELGKFLPDSDDELEALLTRFEDK